MKKLSEVYNSFRPKIRAKAEERFLFWNNSGFLDSFEGKALKQHMSRAYTMTAKIVIEDFDKGGDIREEVYEIILPMVARTFITNHLYYKKGMQYHLVTRNRYHIHEGFKFNQAKIKGLIKFANDCFNYSDISKFLKNVDLQAEYCAFLTNLYIAEQNELNKI